jgi:hypothetical protein
MHQVYYMLIANFTAVGVINMPRSSATTAGHNSRAAAGTRHSTDSPRVQSYRITADCLGYYNDSYA